ncbi:MAG TPA: ABC transporter substrate-binding protein [Candidatus Binatia bacterium]|jgi:putative ABC transport system substrate-binding protein|nr:ABC transporter substrate-binding protein [Candidatus Binatia bacterium]
MNNTKITCLAVGILVLALCLPAEAQQGKKIPRVGFLTLIDSPSAREVFRQGLRDLGYIEGQNIVIEYRHAADRAERLPELAAELVRLKVDVIVAGASQSALAAKNATQTIPVIFTGVGDPVAQGLVASLARPGANITGLASLSPEVGGKRLELLKEVSPTTTHVAVLWNPTNSSNSLQLKEVRTAAQTLALRVQSLEVSKPDDIEQAFTVIARERADVLLIFADPFLTSQRVRFADRAAKHRLPAMYGQSDSVEAGGLMSYAPSFREMGRRAAYYVDKILKGNKPADLPVEQPTKFELVINLKTAKQIGLTIPPNVLARADKVIK